MTARWPSRLSRGTGEPQVRQTAVAKPLALGRSNLCVSIPARDPLQVRRLGDQVGGVPAPRGLAAARAVAVNETHERPPDAIAHGAAETASVKQLISHDQAPFLIGIGQRYSDRLDPVKKLGEVFLRRSDSGGQAAFLKTRMKGRIRSLRCDSRITLTAWQRFLNHSARMFSATGRISR